MRVVATMGLVIVVGVINFFGPKHSGSVSIYLAIPAVLTVITIIGLSSGYLNTAHLEPRARKSQASHGRNSSA